MRKRPLGKTGLVVSELAIGTWGLSGDAYGKVEESDAEIVLRRAIDMGFSLIDTSDAVLDRAAEVWLAERGVAGEVRSLVLDDRRAVVFVRASTEVPQSFALGESLKAHLKDAHERTVDAVYWKFRAARPAP